MTIKTQKQTRSSRRPRISPALVISSIALFAALASTAAALPGSNTVRSDDIVDQQVKNRDIKDNAVDSLKIRARRGLRR